MHMIEYSMPELQAVTTKGIEDVLFCSTLFATNTADYFILIRLYSQ